MKSVYREIVGGGQAIPHMLAILNLSYNDIGCFIHETEVDLENKTIKFYCDEIEEFYFQNKFEYKLIKESAIPGVSILEIAYPDSLHNVLEGVVKIQEESEAGNVSPEERYTKIVDQMKTVNPYEEAKRVQKLQNEFQSLSKEFNEASLKLKEKGISKEGNRPNDDEILPESYLEKINSEVERINQSNKPKIYT